LAVRAIAASQCGNRDGALDTLNRLGQENRYYPNLQILTDEVRRESFATAPTDPVTG
jgi:hypothetical protein